MRFGFDFEITHQPNETTCGPACLHAVYRHYGLDHPLDQIIRAVQSVPGGGTLAVMLGLDALRRGFDATIYTCDLNMFDPSWFENEVEPLPECLRRQALNRNDPKQVDATRAYLDYLELGGRVLMDDITLPLLAEFLSRRTPIIAGLSATWLYRCKRERLWDFEDDDISGIPTGHFVVIHGVEDTGRTADIADPYCHLPDPGTHAYTVNVNRLISAILLGIVTYDAKLLLVTPREPT